MQCPNSPSPPHARRCYSVPIVRYMCSIALACFVCTSPSRASGASANISLSLYAASGFPGQTVTLKSLVYSGGAPVSGLPVHFYVDGTEVASLLSGPTDAEAPYIIPTTMAAGTHNVTVSFAGNGTYNAASRTTAALTVAGAHILFSLYLSIGSDGQSVTLSTLMYSGGSPVVGRTVSFAVDGISLLATGITDVTGKASVSYKIPLTMTAGSHNVTASFAGDSTYLPGSRTTVALRVVTGKALLNFSLYAASGTPGQTVTLKSLVYGGGAPVSGVTLQFAVDGIPVGVVVSGASSAICAAPAPTVTGTHNVTVTFAGNSTYFPGSRTTAALTVKSGGLQTDSPWPRFHGNAANTGVGVGSGATGALRWRFQTGNGLDWASPAIGADGTVYVGSQDQYVYALDPADGSQEWRYHTIADVQSTPAIASDGTVYVGSEDDYVYALNPADGSLKWHYLTSGGVQSSPAIGADGTVYVGSGDGYVYALNPADGSLKWHHQTADGVLSAPAIGADGTIYVGSMDSYVYALHPADGSLKWNFLTSGSVQSSPAVGADGTVYVGGWDHYVYALNPADGTQRWRYRTGAAVLSSPAIGPDGTVYAGSNDSYVYALNADGTLRWRFLTGGSVDSSPAIGADGTVYIGSFDGYLYALNPADGSQKWRYQTGNYVYSSPAIGADGTVYVGSFDGYVHAIE